MTLTLVIDDTIRCEIFWERSEDELRQQVRTWMERNERSVLALSDGTTMLVNWPARDPSPVHAAAA